LAQKLHPDKNLDNPEAQEKFQKVQEAYVILSEHKSRREYDQEHRAEELR
jgi:curved DNA-binding protein CbpA